MSNWVRFFFFFFFFASLFGGTFGLVAYLMACIFILYQVYTCIFTGLISSSNSKMYITKSANIRL